MKIIQVAPYMEQGGTEKHIISLCSELSTEAELYLLAPQGSASLEIPQGIPYYSFPRFEQNVFGGIQLFNKHLKTLVRQQPNIIHIHAAAELLFLSKRVAPSIPHVFTFHGYAGNFTGISYKIGVWAANRYADAVICVSHREREVLAKMGLDMTKTVVVYNGTPRPTAKRQNRTRTTPTIGTIARLEKPKGISDLVDAAGILIQKGYQINLLIVGDGSERKYLQKRAETLGIATTFTGYLSTYEKDKALATMDIFVLPSYQEALPLVCLEALAMGIPVIATEVGGIPEIVTPEVGLLVPPKNPTALADALKILLDNTKLMEEMGEAGRLRYNQYFTISKMAHNTQKVYFKIMNERDNFN